MTPDASAPDEGVMEVNVTCSTSLSRDYEGRGADEVNAQYTKALHRILVSSKSIDMKSLCVIEGKHVWCLYVDVIVLDNGGNLFDTICLASYTALNNTRIPKIELIPGATVEDIDFDINDNPAACEKLEAKSLPICVTLSKVSYIVGGSDDIVMPPCLNKLNNVNIE